MTMRTQNRDNREKRLTGRERRKLERMTTDNVIFIADFDDFAIKLKDGTYMDILQIRCKDLENASSSDLQSDIIAFQRLFNSYSDDLKIIGINSPIDTALQRKYLKRRIENCRNEVYLELLHTKMEELEDLSRNRTEREYYLFFYAENEEKYRENLSTINRILAEGNILPLVKRIDREKIEELLEKLHNKNSYITG